MVFFFHFVGACTVMQNWSTSFACCLISNSSFKFHAVIFRLPSCSCSSCFRFLFMYLFSGICCFTFFFYHFSFSFIFHFLRPSGSRGWLYKLQNFACFSFHFIFLFFFLLAFLDKSMLSSVPSLVSAFSQCCSVSVHGFSTLCVERTCVPWSHVARH